MKLKQAPDDFFVEEFTDVAPGTSGPFAFYRLEKRNWTTPDAIDIVRRRWQVEAGRVSYGGLKDRHAHTVQYLTVYRGPRRDLGQQGVSLRYLGQVPEPYSSRAIRANRFRIVMRNLTADSVAAALAAADEVRRDGVTNYFDDQRFGSVGPGGAFVGKHMVLGDYEAALKQALAAPYEFDRAEQRREKETLREYWGRWDECKERLPRGHARSLIDYLRHHPVDFRGAVARLRPELQGLYLSAFQSHLWNRTVAAWLSTTLPSDQQVRLATRLGDLVMPREPDESTAQALSAARVTLPAARSPLDEAAPWAAAARGVLAAEGLTWTDLKLRGLRKPFFTRGDREVLVFPHELTAAAMSDERHAGRQALQLGFTLPRGSYATMVVKRLSAA